MSCEISLDYMQSFEVVLCPCRRAREKTAWCLSYRIDNLGNSILASIVVRKASVLVMRER